MKAIILAAGKGERLMPLTKNTPKSLLELGNGSTVLESQLGNIKKCKIDDVVIVGGYKVEQIEAKIKDYDALNIRVVYNPFYDSSNNLISAWMAKYEMDDDFILMNGDDIFRPCVLEGLLEVKAEISMIIDRKDKYEEDDMKVITRGNRVFEVSKEITPDKANGESIGIMKFQSTGIEKFISTLEKMVRNKKYLGTFYLAALQQIMTDGFPVHYYECSKDDWAEIDFHPDLKFIQENIYKYFETI